MCFWSSRYIYDIYIYIIYYTTSYIISYLVMFGVPSLRLSSISMIDLHFDVSAWNSRGPSPSQVVIEGLRGRDTILSLKQKLMEDWSQFWGIGVINCLSINCDQSHRGLKKIADWSQFWRLNVLEWRDMIRCFWFYLFSTTFNAGHWDKLAAHIGIVPVGDHMPSTKTLFRRQRNG